MQEIDQRDRELLGTLQSEIPLVSTPFALIGQAIDMSEKEVIKRIERLKRDGLVRHDARLELRASDVERTSDEYKRRHLVLSSMALFKRFGWSPAVVAGTYEVFELIISKLNPGLSKAEFINTIDQMVRRKILQGDHFLYITPRALHIKLWTDWWGEFGSAINMVELVPTLSEHMRQWFGEMIEYAHAAPVSKKLAQDM